MFSWAVFSLQYLGFTQFFVQCSWWCIILLCYITVLLPVLLKHFFAFIYPISWIFKVERQTTQKVILQQKKRKTKRALEGFPLTWRVDTIRFDRNARLCHVTQLFLAWLLKRTHTKKKSHGNVTLRVKVKVVEVVNLLGFTDAGSQNRSMFVSAWLKAGSVLMVSWGESHAGTSTSGHVGGASHALEVAATQIHIEIWGSGYLVYTNKTLLIFKVVYIVEGSCNLTYI